MPSHFPNPWNTLWVWCVAPNLIHSLLIRLSFSLQWHILMPGCVQLWHPIWDSYLHSLHHLLEYYASTKPFILLAFFLTSKYIFAEYLLQLTIFIWFPITLVMSAKIAYLTDAKFKSLILYIFIWQISSLIHKSPQLSW